MRGGSVAIRGVNLGNWLVLETWMGDSPLSRAGAEDDRAYIDLAPAEERARELTQHYRSYVTEQTFAWLADTGADLIRIPVPYHLFGTANHVACIDQLDDAFAWAQTHGLKILIDLHTVPLGQSGSDNSGYSGMCAWHRSKERVDQVLDLLDRIAARYAGHPSLWGIEPLNEPASLPVLASNMLRYGRGHMRRVMKSRLLTKRATKQFYQRFYDRVRSVVGSEVNLVFHDRFSLRGWESFDPGHGDDHVWIDSHLYAAFADRAFRRYDLAEYLELIERFAKAVRRASAAHPVLVGEWSLANHAKDLRGMDEEQTKAWYQAYGQAQLAAWDQGGGSCFWSLRASGAGRENWSYERCVERGWIDLSL